MFGETSNMSLNLVTYSWSKGFVPNDQGGSNNISAVASRCQAKNAANGGSSLGRRAHRKVGPETLLRAAHKGSALLVAHHRYSPCHQPSELPLAQLSLKPEQAPKGGCSSAAPGRGVSGVSCQGRGFPHTQEVCTGEAYASPRKGVVGRGQEAV